MENPAQSRSGLVEHVVCAHFLNMLIQIHHRPSTERDTVCLFFSTSCLLCSFHVLPFVCAREVYGSYDAERLGGVLNKRLSWSRASTFTAEMMSPLQVGSGSEAELVTHFSVQF